MAQFDNLIVNGFSRFLNSASGNLVGSATYAGITQDFTKRDLQFNTVTCADSASTAGTVSSLSAERTLTFTGDLSGSISGIKGGAGVKQGYVYIVKMNGENSTAVTASAASGNNALTWVNNNKNNFLNACYSASAAKKWVDDNATTYFNKSYSCQSAWDWISSRDTNLRNSAASGSAASALLSNIMTANATARSAKSATTALSAQQINKFTGTAKNTLYIDNLYYNDYLARYLSATCAYNTYSNYSATYNNDNLSSLFAYYTLVDSSMDGSLNISSRNNLNVIQKITSPQTYTASTYILDAAIGLASNSQVTATSSFTEYISSYLPDRFLSYYLY